MCVWGGVRTSGMLAVEVDRAREEGVGGRERETGSSFHIIGGEKAFKEVF